MIYDMSWTNGLRFSLVRKYCKGENVQLASVICPFFFFFFFGVFFPLFLFPFFFFFFFFWCFYAFFKHPFWTISWRSVFIGGGSRSAWRKPPTFDRKTDNLILTLFSWFSCYFFVVFFLLLYGMIVRCHLTFTSFSWLRDKKNYYFLVLVFL